MPKPKKSSKKIPQDPIGRCESCGHEFFEKSDKYPKGIAQGEKLPVKCPNTKCHSDEITDLRIVDIKKRYLPVDEEEDDIEDDDISVNDVIN